MPNQSKVQLVVSGVQPYRDKAPSLQNHFYRREQFFLSLSVSLSPFFTSCGSLISIDEFHNFLVTKLEGTEKTVKYGGEEFQAILLNDRQRRGIGKLWEVTTLAKRTFCPDICLYECIDEELRQLLQKSDANSTGIFVTKLIGDIDMSKSGEEARVIGVDDWDGFQLSEAFLASQHKNIIKPSVYFLARNIDGDRVKGVHCLSPYQGVGDLHDFMFSALWDSKNPIYNKSSCNGEVPLREAIMAPIIKGFIEGLKHMHDSKFVFGDLKLENVIVCEDHQQELGYTGKLIDFDLSCKEGSVTRPVGTPGYLAPEYAAEKLTRKSSSDIWALGINLFEIFTGIYYRYVQNYQEFKKAALNGELEFNTNDDKTMEHKNFSATLKELIKMLLVVDPEKRPNCDEILKASWFKECDEVINDNKDFLETTLREMAEKSRAPRASAGKQLESEQIETYEEDQPVPRKQAYLFSPKENLSKPKEYKIKNKSKSSRDAQPRPSASTADFSGGANGGTNIPPLQLQQQAVNEIKEEIFDGVSNVSTSSFENKSSNRVIDQESIPSSSGTPTSPSAPSSPNSKSDPTSVSVDLTRQPQQQQPQQQQQQLSQNKLNRIPSEKPKRDSNQTTSSDSPVIKSPEQIPKNNKNNKIAKPKTADVSRLRSGFFRDGLRSLKKKACAMIEVEFLQKTFLFK